jgi:hypothetical protein
MRWGRRSSEAQSAGLNAQRGAIATIGGFPGASCGYALPKRDSLGLPGSELSPWRLNRPCGRRLSTG